MRKPEQIQEEIDKLKQELERSRLAHSKTRIYRDNERGDDCIGFFDLSKARLILSYLHSGKTLLLDHQGIGGEWRVFMNPQGNRVLVEWIVNGVPAGYHPQINEDTIMTFIVWRAGDWYILNENYGKD